MRNARKIDDPSEFQAPDYAFYLAKFSKFNDGMWRKYPREEYTSYLNNLLTYLLSFIERSQVTNETSAFVVVRRH